MKNDYNMNSFWTIKNEETHEIKYHIRINGVLVEVPEDVYRVCFNSYMKMLRTSKAEAKRGMLSLDNINDDGNTLLDTLSSDSFENNVDYLQDIVTTYVNKLKDPDKTIIKMYIFGQMSRSEIARNMHLPKSTVIYKVDSILKKLKNILKNLVD